jgi:hypothetical protein
MSDDRDDDAWLDVLRGRAHPEVNSATRIEAQDTRRAVLDANRRTHASTSTEPEELQRLLFRLRREGLLSSGAFAWKVRSAWAIAATLVLAIAFTALVPSSLFESGDEPVLRGEGAVQIMEVTDVNASAMQIESVLRGAGASVAVFELGNGAREIAATVPEDRIDAATRELASFGIQAPGRDGALRVELRPKR